VGAFKSKKWENENSKTILHWEYRLKPASFELEFRFKIKPDSKNISKELGDNLAFNRYYLKRKFGEQEILRTAKEIDYFKKDEFNISFVVYSYEHSLVAINGEKSKKHDFGFNITFDALSNKDYNINELEIISKDFSEKFDKKLFESNKFVEFSRS